MKLFMLSAIVAAIASGSFIEDQKWPWQVGKEYVYNVDSYTWTKFDESNSNGNAFKAQFIIRVKAPGQLLAKLESPLYAQVQGKFDVNAVPADLKYEPVHKIDQPFEILVDGGRVLSLNVPSKLPASLENVLKGLVSALQVDLSSSGIVQDFPNSFDKKKFEGLFKKTEADVTGDCETLYSVSPVSKEWRRELPDFAEEPIEITKSKNYGSCKKRIAYDFGVPEGALWQGIASGNNEKQFIQHTSESRMLVGKQGTIYKSEILSSVFVNPLLFGKQKSEVYSNISFYLVSVQPVSSTEWKKSDEVRAVDSLLYTMGEIVWLDYDVNNVVNAQKVLQEITPLLQSPDKLLSKDFLSKFLSLVRITNSMNCEQLTQLTNSLEVTKTSKNGTKTHMWILYRDAVAQTGTYAAFKEIKSWILTKKIQGEEAAEVITSIASVLRNRTTDILAEFVSLVSDPIVREQKFLNTTALLASTKLLRLSQEDSFVVENVIPLANNDLTQAIIDSDNTKAQVYIRALGNLAHPDILKIFAPYLEGRIKISTYLRTQMVISLKTLANTRNEKVRAVLFMILKNTAEPYEVRVAAALNIFLAFPTAEMMQIMAHMTNDDPSTQVRAVLANSIAFIVGLKDPRFEELVKTAKSVKNIVSKEKFGYRYSTDSLFDSYTSKDELSHFRELSYIGSENNMLPKYHRAALRLRGTGWTEENWATLSVSDMQDLLDYIVKIIYEPDEVDTDFKFSAKKIIEVLNIKQKSRNPVEGALFIDNMNQQRLFTFNEEDLTAFVTGIIKNAGQLVTGAGTQFIKVLTDKQVLVTFPLPTGMPFVYGYSEPIAFIVQGQSNYKLGTAKAGSLKNQLIITYARNMDGSVGFVDTLGAVFASTGIINKLQVSIPIETSLESKNDEIKLNFEFPEEDVDLIHLSVTPYNSLQKISSLSPVAEDPSTKIIKRSAKTAATNFNLGEFTGVGLYLKGYSYSSDYNNPIWNVFKGDIVAIVRDLLYQKDVAWTQFDLKYIAKKSKNKSFSLSFYRDTLYNQKQSGEMGPATFTNDVAPTSAARSEQLSKRVASGIDSAQVNVVDFSAVFNGEKKVEYGLTAALANSFVDNKVQAALLVRSSQGKQINAVFKIIKPKITPLNFKEALENEIEATYEADIKFANETNIKINAVGKRSKEYTRWLSDDPLAKQCLQESNKGNFYQKDCYKMIIKAHAPDFFNATVTYDRLNSPKFLDFAESSYQTLMRLYSWEGRVFQTNVKDGQIQILSKVFYDKYIYYKFTSNYGVLLLSNIKGMYYYPYAMAFYAPISNWERSRNWFTGYQNLPYCAVDSSKVSTFSGRSYDYSLTSSWHVVMVDDSYRPGTGCNLVILARRPSDKQEEVYISYTSENGKTVEVDIKPTAVAVKSNTAKVSEGALTTYWDDIEELPVLEYYTLAPGVQVFSINNGALRLVYDSQRLVIFTDSYRSYTTGICGKSTSQTRDDYMTPWGLVDLSDHYGASFSLEGEFSDPKTVELKKEAQRKAY